MSNQSKKSPQLAALHERHPGLTKALGDTYFEAASVCFDRHHDSPVDISIECDGRNSIQSINFQKPDTRMINSWANDIDTTESGAYGVCLATVEFEEQLVAVRRAETLTGSDWYVAPVGKELTTFDDLEHCYRLEVSGLDTGGQAMVEARLKEKIKQTRHGKSNLPAIAAVVGFKEKIVKTRRVSEE